MFYQIKTVSSTYIFMGQYKKYNLSLSLDATIMVSRKLLNHSSKKIWVQSFLKVASYYAHLKKFIIRKNTVLFLNYMPLKLKPRVFLAGHTVAMVMYCITKMMP